VALMTPELDQALALPVTASIAALAAALQPEAPGAAWVARAAAAGALAAVAEFFSYGAAVFVLIGALAVLAFAGRRAARRAALAAGVALAAAAAVLALERLAGHRPLSSALTALSIHRQQFTVRRSYLAWVAFDPLDLFWFLGPPLVALLAGVGARAVTRRAGRRETDLDRFRATAVLGIVALMISGIVRGEVGRLLIPIMPVLLVAAVASRDAEGNVAGPSARFSFLLAVLLTATAVVIRLTWDVP